MSEVVTVEREFVVQGELGLHARPAGRFAAKSGRFESEVSLSRGGADDEWVNGQSVLSILSLAATQNTRLVVRAVGVDAEEAVAALGALLEDAGLADPPI